MLSRRVPWAFVCLRCRLSLASRGRIPNSALRTSIINTAVPNAPSRSYSDSAERTTWVGRLPAEEPGESLSRHLRAAEHTREDETPTSKQPLPPTPPQAHDVGKAADPWQGAFESAIGDKSLDQKVARTYDIAGGFRDRQQQEAELGEKPVYREIKVAGRGSAMSRGRTVTLSTTPEFYTAKGRRLKPTNRDLPIGILGKPAHALVLRDAGPRKKKLGQVAPEEPGSLLNLAKIYESTEGDVPSSAEVLHNIHELRPAEPVLAQREFERLKETLLKGFTKAQLAAYIQKSSLAKKDKDESAAGLRPWVLEQWPWAPEVGSDSATSDALLQGYVSKSTPPKERLVIGLMRHCWGVGIQELQSRQGYLDVRVQDLQFDLLMLGNRSWLESISKSLFEPGTQIELIRSEKTVRIVAPKVTAELILQEIVTLLDRAQTRVLDATHISYGRLDQSVLDEVGQITHTVVRYDKSGKNIQVSWITPPENQREDLEDLADVTYRLLYSAYLYKQRCDATMEVQPRAHELDGWYLRNYHSKSKLAWKDRLALWSRWAVATPRRGGQPAVSEMIVGNDLICRDLDAAPSQNFAPDGWSAEPQVTTKATFGHVLHRDSDPSRMQEGSLSGDRKENHNDGVYGELDRRLERTISPVIPPLKSLATLTAGSEATAAAQTSILVRFLPVTSNPSLPSLELTLLTDPGSDAVTHHSLRAVTRVATHDILLPAQPVDVRLTATTSHVLPGYALGSSCPEILSFLTASDLRPQEGILSTPSRPPPLNLPSRILPAASSSYSSSDIEATQAQYIFAGLELHRHVATSVDGWKLSYTSVEAGQGGGRRAELALEGVRVGDGGVDEMGLPVSEFERFERSGGRADGVRAAVTEIVGDEGEQRLGSKEFVATLSRLALGKGLAWVGEVPDGEVDGERG